MSEHIIKKIRNNPFINMCPYRRKAGIHQYQCYACKNSTCRNKYRHIRKHIYKCVYCKKKKPLFSY